MAEPPYKRPRRDDDRSAPRYDARSHRDQRAPRSEAETNGDRNRSYRSRSPERRDRDRAYGGTASSRARESGRGGRRDDPRETGRRDDRKYDRRDDGRDRREDRGGNRDRERRDDPRGGRDERSGYKRARDEDAPKARSRSPKRDRSPQRVIKGDDNASDRGATPEQGLPLRERNKSGQATPSANLKFELKGSRANSTEPHSRRGSVIAAQDTQAAAEYVKERQESPVNKKKKPTAADFLGDAMDEDDEDDVVVVEEDPAMAAMQAMMGFGGFGTTKQKKVPGNDVGAVRKEKKTEYRQYMNRVGGFNRPLDDA